MNINMLIGFFFCVVFFHVEKANANDVCYSKIKIDVEYTDEPLLSVRVQSEITEARESFKKDLNRLAISGSYEAQASVMGVASAGAKITASYDQLTEAVRHLKESRSVKTLLITGYQVGTKLRFRTTTTTLTINGKSGKMVEKMITGSTSSKVSTNFAELKNQGERESTPTTCLIPCSAACNLCHTCRRNTANEKALIRYASDGNIDQVKRLVKKTYVQAQHVDEEYFGDGGNFGIAAAIATIHTALIEAAKNGHRNVAKVLLAHGANPGHACDYNFRIGYIMDC